MNLRVAFWGTACLGFPSAWIAWEHESLEKSTYGVNVVSAKVSPKVKSILYGQIGKILVTKSHDLALSDKQRKLVFPFIRKLAELHTGDF